MKFTATLTTTIVAALALGQTVSAQNVTECAVAGIFNQCLQNEDTYIKTCIVTDYACLCRWHTVKLSCWNNCPNEPGRATQQSLTTSHCAMPGANATSIWSSWTPPTSAVTIIPSTTASPSASASATPTVAKSAASTLTVQQGLFAIGALAAYMVL
ncbi:hypothetical protein J3Q64DRAFT_1708927 [Phycomyces blakesleeanus]|uniref:GPI anchored serine-threonine rich protein n=2 Tax=Phycomyces blakesleeanus TaxID=4837 RepID=A0A167KIE0_PHYB8|nr:hypothetical protein PHYBLDRAFT_150839 [Phycomyces blakesleeanus NRRL 1555(-)]OAD68176.1 hypothetical protein PHYBLDRAFT_150839 [Phycomyces blakesleeanus NRRL 1555(-)]|eukprot:XP_018286216.1 hypothetical protein PHYBLDRAFT_150839 [Phycomyces blakesleeanus NRRL 1555(-)]